MSAEKMWANSGDSHLLESNAWFDSLLNELDPTLATQLPRSVQDADGEWETIHVGGETFRRRLPRVGNMSGPEGETIPMPERAPGANDPHLRLRDLDGEGIWGEVIYPSLGIWNHMITDPETVVAVTRAINGAALTFQEVSNRYVCCASLPLLVVDDGVAEVGRARRDGFQAVFLPTQPPFGRPFWNDPEWDPLWDAIESHGLIGGVHIGTDPHRPDQRTGVTYGGRGGAILNYVETSYSGQRFVTQIIAAGVLERHPGLRILVSEGGATWGPFVADRMDEAYRQHGAAVHPRLSRAPSEYLYSQVYASFQHDPSAVFANSAMGWPNVMWGSDYPHYEGTYGHTQETLHSLFDSVDASTSRRIRLGVFEELFPRVPSAPAGNKA